MDIFSFGNNAIWGSFLCVYIFEIGCTSGDFEYWASKLSVPMATVNTMVLISSSVSMVMAWALIKIKRFFKI